MTDYDRIVDNYAERRRRNQMSKRWAKRDRQPWSEDEDQFLVDEWIDVHPSDRDEALIAQCLERTIESCRVRCEHIRKRLGIQQYTVTKTTTTTVEYRGFHDDPDDQWWSPEYYK